MSDDAPIVPGPRSIGRAIGIGSALVFGATVSIWLFTKALYHGYALFERAWQDVKIARRARRYLRHGLSEKEHRALLNALDRRGLTLEEDSGPDGQIVDIRIVPRPELWSDPIPRRPAPRVTAVPTVDGPVDVPPAAGLEADAPRPVVVVDHGDGVRKTL